MSENTPNKTVRDDEIDLLDLLRRIGRTLNRWAIELGRVFLISVVFLLRRWLPLGLSVALGLGTSFLLKTTSPSSYTSELVLRNNNADPELRKISNDIILKNNAILNADMILYVNRLKTYCKERNIYALAKALSISEQQVKNISDISAYWIIDKGNDNIPDYVEYNNDHDVYDTVNVRMQDRFNISVKVNSPQELSNVRNGIISYLNNDSLFQQRNRVRLKQNLELLSRLNKDITQLDSLQKVKYFEETRNRQPLNGGQMVFLQEQNTQLIYADIYSLYSRKQVIESEGDLYHGIVTVLSDFSLPAERYNGTAFYAIKIIPILFSLTLLILILLANRKKLIEVYNKY
jgi:hypothetical protein